MIDRQHVEVFLTLARELHFGRTAERLHLSTSRVSQSVRSLERSVGAPLFRRTSRRVELTPLGERLHEELRPAWEQVEQAWQRAVTSARGLTGSLSVAFVGPAAGQLLARAIARFADLAPDCEVALAEWSSYAVGPRLRDGDAELALSVLPVEEEGIRSGPVLVREALVLAVPVGHPFARLPVVEPAELSRTPVLEVEGLPRVDDGAAAASATSLTEGLTHVGAGRGVLAVGASTSRYQPRPDVSYVPLAGDGQLRWGLSWRADGTTARVLAFVEAARALVG